MVVKREPTALDAVETMLATWQAGGHLDGPAFAGHVSALHHAARAVDRAAADTDTQPKVYADAAKSLLMCIWRVAPKEVTRDKLDVLLEGLATNDTAIRD